MKKIICIGECALDIIFGADKHPLGSMPGGRIANAATLMARAGLPVWLVSEASADSVGDMVIAPAREAGVDVSAVDRFTEGHTPVVLYTPGDTATQVTRYEDYPEECFDVVWPRIDEGDIVVFGGYYAIDARMRRRMAQLLHHASERKALLVYLPGFAAVQETRITRVMPAILENLEIADMVIASDTDLRLIFGADSGDRCYHDHIDFYCRSLLCIDTPCQRISYYSGTEVTQAGIPAGTGSSLIWNAGIVAGTIEALAAMDADQAMLMTPPDDIRRQIITRAVGAANEAIAALSQTWQRQH